MNDTHIPTLVYEYIGIPAGRRNVGGQIKRRRDKHPCKRNSLEWLKTVADYDDDDDDGDDDNNNTYCADSTVNAYKNTRTLFRLEN